MKAEFKHMGRSNARNLSGDKELVRTFNVVALHREDGMKEIITVRCWMGRSRSSSVVYATIWTFGGPWVSGHGKAGGGGYCKTSAAIGEAIESAGIELDQDIHGRGESSVREALRAIAHAMGYDGILIVENG